MHPLPTNENRNARPPKGKVTSTSRPLTRLFVENYPLTAVTRTAEADFLSETR
jgi:hypothetical protein